MLKALSIFCFLILTLLMFTIGQLYGQVISQTVRGRIIDQDSRMPLSGANVVISDSQTFLGASTDSQGNFRIENVPVGRISLIVSYIGYENKVIPNILVTSGKETVLDISIQESFTTMDEIVINADKDKSQIANEMALISVRGFTVEETKRYAGSFNDPARMVSGYAGVNTDAGGDNSIIVRGNSPKGIQWRLEGIEIPNPNHFSDEGATGGPINALNSQMLADSEFYTGAFPPEYGNALSGVFDMRLRKGNNEKREYSFSLGVLGTDATVEGPFIKGGGSSYLVNYRYSTLSLLDKMGVIDFGGIPKYQDLSFKFHIPTKAFGTFSIFGLGGKSYITEEFYDEENKEQLLGSGTYKANMGVVGLTQYWPVSPKTYFQNSISISQNGSGYLGHEFLGNNNIMLETENFNLAKNTLRAATTLNHKFNARHNFQTGFIFSRHNFDFNTQYFDENAETIIKGQNMIGDANHYQGFVSWKYRPFENISIVSGLHAHKISMNNEISVEPRTSVRWQFHPLQAFTAGFGIHGKMESLTNYYSIVTSEVGSPIMPNMGLGFTKARHYVVGYENKLSDNLFLKAEAYYQQLYNIPVENNPFSSYSLINQVEGFTDRVLVNEGTGENLGLELTVERYFANNYYFLATASLFDSKYTALDGIRRNTLFNSNHVGNLLFGKEFKLNSKKQKNKVLGINSKVTLIGARRLTPINMEASLEMGRTIYYEDQAFSLKGDDVFIANLALSYRIDKKKFSQELKLDIQNISNNQAILGYYFDKNSQSIKNFKQLPLLPVMIYTINF